MRGFVLVAVVAGCGTVRSDQSQDDAPRADAPLDGGVDAAVDAPHVPVGAFVLVTPPDPSTVLNTIGETFRFPNNLQNSIWHRQTNMLISGEFTTAKYFLFSAAAATYPATPDQGSTIHGRMVQIAARNVAIYSTAAGPNTTPSPAASFQIATINLTTGVLENEQAVTFADGFSGSCAMTSASATEFFCFDGATTISRYLVTAGSATLTPNGTVTLSVALPTQAQCTVVCFGGTFAFDGAFFYFSSSTQSSNNLSYLVYTANGTLQATHAAAGGGSIDSVYFDWSIGRYSTHDGFGGRTGGTLHGTQTDSDTHTFSPVSANHMLDL